MADSFSFFEYFTIRKALKDAGLDKTDILIQGVDDMPNNIFGMTLGDEGFALNRSLIGDVTELSKTLKHEMQHVLDRRAIGDPGAYGQALEDAATAAEQK